MPRAADVQPESTHSTRAVHELQSLLLRGVFRDRERPLFCVGFFFFNDTATTEIYTLSLHDALPISSRGPVFQVEIQGPQRSAADKVVVEGGIEGEIRSKGRSEEHTSELQSQSNLVCRLLLEKKKKASDAPGGRRPAGKYPQHARSPRIAVAPAQRCVSRPRTAPLLCRFFFF